MSLRDGEWLSCEQVRVVGPLTGVTAPMIRETLIALHRQHPNHPSVCRMDREARRWVPVSTAEYAYLMDSDVSVLVWPEPGTAESVAVAAARAAVEQRTGERTGIEPHEVATAETLREALTSRGLGDRPLRVLVCGEFVGIRMSHAIGDARVFNTLVAEIFGAGAAGRPPRLAFPRPTRLPLARASLRFFGRDPRRVVTLLKTPRPVLEEPPADEPRRAWQPDVSATYIRSEPGTLSALRTWRDTHQPGVSAAAVLFAAARAAFEECGLQPGDPGMMILVDARRYLPKGATVDGNFAPAQYVIPSDTLDPRAIHEVMSATIAAGRPLSSLALRDLYALRARFSPTSPPAQVRVKPSPQLTITHIGRLDGYYSELPWACPPEYRMMLSAPTPGGPEAVTVTFAEMDGELHLNVTFHRSTFEEKAMRRIGELICADPVALVEAHRPR
ncbi:hypothetical protein Raf01_20370 [Rugosimonospora africana]|uniref:Condensation domain-containing protein n=2 Tax=Rugosimonospora africana TaxID=556532 RepID=A0A8J3QQK1_9ACTN|nr:hypothetical protein Raf01_20370 [Rugosimonospora africana]